MCPQFQAVHTYLIHHQHNLSLDQSLMSFYQGHMLQLDEHNMKYINVFHLQRESNRKINKDI